MEHYRNKIKDLQQIKEKCDQLKASGQRVVFTNGCFDILHPGHTRYLWAARALGDHLVVAVNSDSSVRAIKGPNRPINNKYVRAELLAALNCVDSVLIFNEDTPQNVINYLAPDILVKGGDWAKDKIVGSQVVEKAGGVVKRIPFEDGFSTTDVIEKILKTGYEL
ncbi:MAG: D-glycero-beta-D-manno-heptose 1-phosphate adenylyltransferase [Desulfobacterales bacterium]|nr:D-glycero-beta-D-manno-heptose 1-phosphate adenylyltransferase [Desulfobacterales bacterium]